MKEKIINSNSKLKNDFFKEDIKKKMEEIKAKEEHKYPKEHIDIHEDEKCKMKKELIEVN